MPLIIQGSFTAGVMCIETFGSGMVALLEHQSHTGDNKGVVCVKVSTVVTASV